MSTNPFTCLLVASANFLLMGGSPVQASSDSETQVNTTIIHDDTVNTGTSSRTEIDSDHSQAAGTVAAEPDTTVERTVVTQQEVVPSAFRDEAVGIKPQLGFVTRSDGVNSNGHGVAGLLLATTPSGLPATWASMCSTKTSR